MTIQELRKHQILVQDPEIDRSQYDAVMQRLRELGEEVYHGDHTDPSRFIRFYEIDSDWFSEGFPNYAHPLTFDQFMNLQIEK